MFHSLCMLHIFSFMYQIFLPYHHHCRHQRILQLSEIWSPPSLRTRPQHLHRKLPFLSFISSAPSPPGLLIPCVFCSSPFSRTTLGLLAQAVLAGSGMLINTRAQTQSSYAHTLLLSPKSHWPGQRVWTADPEHGRTLKSVSREAG